MLKVRVVTGAAALGILVTAPSCKTRNPDSEVKLRTDNGAGIPPQKDNGGNGEVPSDDRTDPELNDALIVKTVQTAERSIGEVARALNPNEPGPIKPIFQIRKDGVDERGCTILIEGGPRGRSDWDCTSLIKGVVKEHFALEGMVVQDWTTKGRFSDSLWKLTACRPSKITLSINLKKLLDSEIGIGFYVGLADEKPLENNNTRSIPKDKILANSRTNGDLVEADFLLLGKCGDVPVKFKPFFDDGKVHNWPSYPDKIIK
jgi:hypothetical protein